MRLSISVLSLLIIQVLRNKVAPALNAALKAHNTTLTLRLLTDVPNPVAAGQTWFVAVQAKDMVRGQDLRLVCWELDQAHGWNVVGKYQSPEIASRKNKIQQVQSSCMYMCSLLCLFSLGG